MELNRTQLALKTLIRDLRLADRVGSVRRALRRELRSKTFLRFGLSLFTVIFILSGFFQPIPAMAAACATGNNVTISVSCEWAGGTHIYTGTLTINAGITVTADSNGGTPVTVVVDSITLNGTITAAGEGHAGGVGTGTGESAGAGGGAGHGGNGGGGGAGNSLAEGGVTYGSAYGPSNFGSGGGDDTDAGGVQGGAGGGAIKIFLTNAGTFTLGNGAVISASGSNAVSADAGAGAGGSIWIDATLGTITAPANGRAVISANGGANAAAEGGGGGGGGRVAIYYTTLNNPTRLDTTAYGGNGGTQTGFQGQRAGAGTIYLKAAADTNGDLIVDNGNHTSSFGSPANTTQSTSSTQIFDDVTIRNGGYYVVPNAFTLSATATLTGGGTRRPSVTSEVGGTLNVPTASFTFTSLDIIHRGSLGHTNGDLTAATFATAQYTYDSDTAEFDFTQLGDLARDSALTLNSGEGELHAAAYDVGNGFGYYVTRNTPSQVIKVNLATMTRVGALTLDSGEDESTAAAIDEANGFLYIGTNTAPVKIVKIDLSSFTRVGALTLDSGEDNMEEAMAIDNTNGFLYVGLSKSGEDYSVGTYVVKVDLSSFTRVGALQLNALETKMGTAVIDEANGFLYLGRSFPGGRVIKIDLGSFTRVGHLTTSGGLYLSSAIDTTNGFAYFGSGHYPGASVTKVDLSSFTQAGYLEFEFGENTVNALAIDAADGYLYAGLNVIPGKVVQVDLDDFTRKDVIAFSTGENQAKSILLDTANDIAYVGTGNTPAQIVKLTGPYAATEGGLTSITMASGSTFMQEGFVSFPVGTFTAQSGSTVTHATNNTSDLNHVVIAATTIDLQAGSTVDVAGKGYQESTGDGAGTGGAAASGGSYGGRGGTGTSNSPAGYGSVTSPADIGSGGGNDGESGTGGNGGGSVKLIVASGGSIDIDGTIVASGANAIGATTDTGGGSGGSVWIDADGATVTGSSTITANGGNAFSNQAGGGGGGGRIAVYSSTNTLASTAYNAAGGTSGTQTTSTIKEGGAGTIYLKLDSQTYGDLVVDNNNRADANHTEMVDPVSQTYDNIIIREGSKYRILSGETLTVNTGGTLSGTGTSDPLLTISSGGTFNPAAASFNVDGVDVSNSGAFTTVTSLTVTNAAFTHGASGTFSATTTSLTLSTGSFTHAGGSKLALTSLTVPSASSFTLANEHYYPFDPAFGAVSIGGTFTSSRLSTFFVDSFTVSSGGNATHAANSTTRAFVLDISATSTIDVASSGTVNVSALGYTGGTTGQSGNGPGGGPTSGFAGGGGHGGSGGSGGAGGGISYDAVLAPIELGSGGGGDNISGTGGTGGGAVKFKVNSGGTVTIAGSITSTGSTGVTNDSAGGAGGSIWIDAIGGTVTGAGTLTANGGVGVGGGGGGAGGRVAVYASTNSLSAGTPYNTAGAAGGASNASATGDGGAGTVYTKLDAQTNGSLIVDNNNQDESARTWQAFASQTYDAVTIREGAKYLIPSGGTLTVAPGGTLTGSGTVQPHITVDGTLNAPSATFTLDSLDVQLNATFGVVTNLTLTDSTFTVDTVTSQFTAGSGNRLGTLTLGSAGTLVTEGTDTFYVDALTANSGSFLTHTNNTTTHAHSLNVSATSTITINTGTTVNLTSLGYSGGTASNPGSGPGAGIDGAFAGGAGHGGQGGTGGTPGGAYGSVKTPTDIGSGGGGDDSSGTGGSGGGAIKLAVNSGGTITINVAITANGGTTTVNDEGGGSGGSIWINAPGGTVTGSGSLSVVGGTSDATNGGGGGAGGRIAVYGATIGLAASGFNAAGGATGSQSTNTNGDGGAGTIFTKLDAQADGSLVVDNNNHNAGSVTDQVTDASLSFDAVTIREGSEYRVLSGFTMTSATSIVGGGTVQPTLRIDGTVNLPATATFDGIHVDLNATLGGVTDLTVRNGLFEMSASNTRFTAGPGNRLGTLNVNSGSIFSVETTDKLFLDILNVNSGGILTHATNTNLDLHRLDISATTSVTVASGGTISANGKGFIAGVGPGNTNSNGVVSVTAGGGAGHGGKGGGFTSAAAGQGGNPYGSPILPTLIGSGGGNSTGAGGAGGGAVRIVAPTVDVTGTIVANGSNGAGTSGGGGSGGSILIDTTTLSGIGVISANGGTDNTNGGGGGGGRVAAYFDVNSGSSPMRAFGGTGNGGFTPNDGGAGTVFLDDKDDAQPNGTLIVDNNNLANAANTIQTCVPDCAQTYDGIILRNASEYEIPNGMTLALASGGTMSGGGVQGELIINNGGSFTPTGATSFTVDDYDVTNSGIFGAVTDLTLMTTTFTHSGTGTFSATLTTMSIEGASVFNSNSTNNGLALTTLNLRNGTYNSNVVNHGLDLTSLEIGRNSAFNSNNDAYYPLGEDFADLNAHGTYLHGSAYRLFVDDLTVQSGGFITHASNTSATVTAKLDISATSSVYVYSGGAISALGKGAPGGLGQGIHSTNGSPGAIGGGGGSYGGIGGSGIAATASNGQGGKVYGSVKQPSDIGTGGGNSTGVGGGGGGWVKITAPVATVVGTVSANGANAPGSSGGGGSGGTVHIDVTTLLGGGTFAANGGNDNINGGGGGGGRIAVYYDTDSGTTTKTAFGAGNGGGLAAGPDRGGAGTIFLDDKNDSLTEGALVVANNNLADDANTKQTTAASLVFDTVTIQNSAQYEVAATTTLALANGGYLLGGGATNGTLLIAALGTFDSASTTFNVNDVDVTMVSTGVFDGTNAIVLDAATFQNAGTFADGLTGLTIRSGGNWRQQGPTLFAGSTLTVENGGTFTQEHKDPIEVDTVLVETGGVITSADNSTTHLYSVNFLTTDFTIQSGGTVTTASLGFDPTTGDGQGGDAQGGGGAGHGGAGGHGIVASVSQSNGGAVYGSATGPYELGSGGGDDTGNGAQQGGAGGGAIKIVATDTLTVDGAISANGGNFTAAEGGGGSGGSVYLIAQTLNATTSISADGGNGGGTNTTGGGCGSGGRVTIEYSLYNQSATTTASAGSACVSGVRVGQKGSVYLNQTGAPPAPPVNDASVINPTNPVTGDDIIVTASATDDTGLESIKIYLDGTDPGNLVKTCTFGPAVLSGNCQHALGPLSSGAHSVTVISEDEHAQIDTDTTNFTVAGDTLDNRLDLSTYKKSATATASLSFTLASTSTGTLTLTFPDEFTVLSAPTSGSGCLSAFGFTSNTMYATKTGCTGGITMTGGTVTNPSVAGGYTVTWTNDNGSAMVYIVDDDNFNISATVEAVITFNVGSQTGTCDGSFSGNGGSLALGGLNLASIATSDANSVPHICTRLSTNAPGGAVVTVRSQNGALASLGTPAHTIPSSSATLVAGTTGYGLCAGSGGTDTGLDVTVPVGASPVRAGPFGGTCSTSAHDVGGLTTSPQIVWQVNDPTQNAFTKIFIKAALGPGVETHNDYQDVLTFIATATF